MNGQGQYLTAGPAVFGYDANGNLTSDGSISLVYDVENRLVSASGARSAALAYDPLGRLYEVSGGPAGVTRFHYDGDELIAEYDAAGTLQRRYVHGAGVDDPLVWYEGASIAVTARRQLFADERGSIVAHTTGSGVVGSIYSYDDWGIPNSETLGASALPTWRKIAAFMKPNYLHSCRCYSMNSK